MWKPWTEKDKQFLRDNCNVLTNCEIEKVIGRTERAVIYAMSTYGIRRSPLVVSMMRGKGNPSREDSPLWKGGRAATQARYNASHREEIAEYGADYKANNSWKVKAINAVNNAVRSGELERVPLGMERHHPDYSKPLETVTMSKSKHSRLHADLRRLQTP